MRYPRKFECGHEGWLDIDDVDGKPGEVVRTPGGAVALDENGAMYCSLCRKVKNA